LQLFVSLARQLYRRIFECSKISIRYFQVHFHIQAITATIKQICHTVHVSVFNDATFIHPSSMISSEHKIMNTIARNLFMESQALIRPCRQVYVRLLYMLHNCCDANTNISGHQYMLIHCNTSHYVNKQ